MRVQEFAESGLASSKLVPPPQGGGVVGWGEEAFVKSKPSQLCSADLQYYCSGCLEGTEQSRHSI